eukprot:scaffold12461_cov67-Phaeocystis_antarctica.AAC.14
MGLPRVAISPLDGSPGPCALESLGAALGAKVNQDGGKASTVRDDGRPHCPGLPVLVHPAHSGGGGVRADGAGATRVLRISEMASERRRWRKSQLGLAQVTVTILVQGRKVCSEFSLARCGNRWPKGRRGRGRGLGVIGGSTAATFGAALGSRRAQ